MPRVRSRKPAKECEVCQRSFLRWNSFLKHLPVCRRAHYEKSAPCARCGKKFGSYDAFQQHSKLCNKTCRFGCASLKFRTVVQTLNHERKEDCCLPVDESETQRLIVPTNVYGLTEDDMNGVFNPSLTDCAQENLQVADNAVDAFNGYLSDAYPGFTFLTAAQCSAFGLFGEEMAQEGQVKIQLARDTEIVVMPCCLRPQHWSLIVHDLKTHKVQLYDPLFAHAPNKVMKMARAVIKSYGSFYELPEVVPEAIQVMKSCQVQDPSTQNCGGHIMKFSEQLAKREPVNVRVNMLDFRKRARKIIIQHLGGHEQAHLF